MAELATRSPAHMSGGQRRRAALATVLACEPDVLVLDEPSANLDPVARRELAQTLLDLDATMLIVTHDLPYAAQLCDRAIVMDAGVIVADGAIDAVLSDAELLPLTGWSCHGASPSTPDPLSPELHSTREHATAWNAFRRQREWSVAARRWPRRLAAQ